MSVPFQLPPKFQNAFEASKAIAELAYAERSAAFPQDPGLAERFAGPILIQTVFFAFCEQARKALAEGYLTASQVSGAVDREWERICDFYHTRERGRRSEESLTTFRLALWRTVTDDQRWKRHLVELRELADRASVGPSASPTLPNASVAIDEHHQTGTSGGPHTSANDEAGNKATERLGEPPGFAIKEDRLAAIDAYMQRWNCSQASLARTARVDPADLSRWKANRLQEGSDKRERIESALHQNLPPTPVSSRRCNARLPHSER